MNTKKWIVGTAALTLAAAIAGGVPALAQNSAPAAGTAYGPGMMRGSGPGMMSSRYGHPGAKGYHRWGGDSTGCGGYGMGYGMGPGMMGGYGMGARMGGGYGIGYGMMHGYGAHALGLSADQREKIADIHNDAMKKAWPVMGQLREAHFQLARVMRSEKPDRAAVDKAYERVSKLQRQLLDMRLMTHQQVLGVLTDQQRKQLREHRYPW